MRGYPDQEHSAEERVASHTFTLDTAQLTVRYNGTETRDRLIRLSEHPLVY